MSSSNGANTSVKNTASGEPRCGILISFHAFIHDVGRLYSKVSGQYHSVKGNVVETIGSLAGAESWQKSGRDEHAAGEAEYNAAQAKAYVEGATDRIKGKVDNVVGAVTGDRQQETSGWFCLSSPPIVVA